MAGLKENTLIGIVKERNARYFDHIKRHHSLLKNVMEGKVEGTRPRRKPRTMGEEQDMELKVTVRLY